MSSVALVSCLGVEGWGPRHLLLLRRGEPGALLQRLGMAWVGAAEAMAEEPRASHLLAGLLRDHNDLLPLASPLLLPRAVTPRYRHRLRSRRGDRMLHLRSWEWCHWQCRWRSCGSELTLAPSLLAPPRRPLSLGPAASAGPAGAAAAEA